MIFHVPQLRTNILSAFNQSSALGTLTPADLDIAINEAYMARVIDLILTNEGYFEEIFAITLVANQEGYSIPKNFEAGQKEFVKANRVQRKIGGFWKPLAYRRKYEEATYASSAAVGDGYIPTYEFRGRKVIFDPTPQSAESGTTRLIYAYQPPRLRSTTVAAGASTTEAESILRLDSGADPRDDYYNGVRVMIVSGAGQSPGSVRTITDYVGRTKIATLDSAWTDFDSDVSTINPKGDAIYSILIHDDFPEIVHELIALDACMSGYMKERASSLQMSDFSTLRRDRLSKKFKSLFENRTDQPKFSRQWHPEFE